MLIIFHWCFFFKFYLFEWERIRGRSHQLVCFLNAHHGRSFVGAEARDQECNPCLPCGWQEPSYTSRHHCLPGYAQAGVENLHVRPKGLLAARCSFLLRCFLLFLTKNNNKVVWHKALNVLEALLSTRLGDPIELLFPHPQNSDKKTWGEVLILSRLWLSQGLNEKFL